MVIGKWKVKNDCGDCDKSRFGFPDLMSVSVGIDRAGVTGRLIGGKMTTTKDTKSTKGRRVTGEQGNKKAKWRKVYGKIV